MLKKLFYLALTLSALTNLAACSNTITWQEEVKLSDGRVVVIDRKLKVKKLGEIGGPGGWRAEQGWLTFKEPKELAALPALESKLQLMVLDYDVNAKEWYVVATHMYCEDWREIGEPNPPYIEYRLQAGNWTRVKLSLDLKDRPINLLSSISSRDQPKFMDLRRKELLDSDPGIASRYKKILFRRTTCS